MQITTIHETKTHLSKLIARVMAGEEIVIGKAGKPVAKLVPYDQHHEPRRGGQWRGKVKIAADFDELPEPKPQRPYQEVIAEIRSRQHARGHQPPRREEVDTYLQAERESWEV